jgi:acetate---CoA ligase (ADP-forming)
MAGATSDLGRFLRPRSVAVVGASERQARSNNAVESMREAGVELFYVNPNRPEVYGERAHPNLESLGTPVDAVLSLVSAPLAVEVVADARRAGAGGVVVIAGGFAESGGAGLELERRLAEAAGGMPVLGPNCNGFIRPGTGARLSGAPRLPFPSGSIGIVTHSGALLGAFGLGAAERGIGYSTLISTGNEMAMDMADCLDFLVDDEETVAIGLVVEAIRSPARFFAAARRAEAAGKPVVALKLGRSARGQEIATSHTGALAGEPWVYDAVFRQHGITAANDLVDLLDRLTPFAHLARDRWSAFDGLAVVSLSGGWSAMASDVCADEGIPLPPLHELRDAINAVIPERTTVNPLDMTGFVMGKADIVRALLDIFGSSDAVDALLVQWFVDETAEAPGAAIIEAAVGAAAALAKPVVIGSIEDGHMGAWAHGLPAQGVAVGRGLRSTVRGLATMRAFEQRRRRAGSAPAANAAPVPRPDGDLVPSAAGPLLTFDATMRLLGDAGIPVAPYEIVEAGDDEHSLAPAFAGPYVVKLADVPHRTEIGGVRLGVSAGELAEAVVAMRKVGRAEGAPERVVVQPQLTLEGEAFVGIQGEGDLGPLVVCGVGGILVELLGTVGGGVAPLSSADADGILDDLAVAGVFEGHRGSRPWDREQLKQIVVATGALADGAQGWLASLDVNPLGLTPDGFVALDGLCLLRTTNDA